MGQRGRGQITLGSPNYPSSLKEILDPPDPLYYVGDFKSSLFDRVLAVVGSRAVTMYGEWAVKTIVGEVASAGITIVSGFMYGVDALAHQAALDVGGLTVAVMAGGVDTIFPAYQKGLYEGIVKAGLAVSEYLKPVSGKWTFARRNRIIAGLAHAVLVVEAAPGSGSLLTAKLAKKYGRKLMAIPGNLNARNSVGTMQLIKNGGEMITCGDDILKFFYGTSNNYRSKRLYADNKRLFNGRARDLSYKIMKVLTNESLTADELALRLKVPASDTFIALTALTVAGEVLERDGRFYAHCG